MVNTKVIYKDYWTDEEYFTVESLGATAPIPDQKEEVILISNTGEQKMGVVFKRKFSISLSLIQVEILLVT